MLLKLKNWNDRKARILPCRPRAIAKVLTGIATALIIRLNTRILQGGLGRIQMVLPVNNLEIILVFLRRSGNWGAAVGDAIIQTDNILCDPNLTFKKDFNLMGTLTNLLGLRPYGQAAISNFLPLTINKGFVLDLSVKALNTTIVSSLDNKFGDRYLKGFGNNPDFFNSVFIYTITNGLASEQSKYKQQ